MLRANYSDDRHALTEAIGIQLTPTDACIVRVHKEVAVGGFLFSNFSGKNGSIWAHVAGLQPGWLTRSLLQAGFDYAFRSCQCRAVFTRIREDNQKSLDFCEKLGFNRVVTLSDVYPDGTGQVILRMYATECRWLPAAWHTPETAH